MALPWDIDAAQVALVAWAAAQSGIPFVMAGQQAAPPAYPYGTIQILSGPVSNHAGGEEHIYDAGDDNVEIRSRNIGVGTVRLQAFSKSQSGTTSARAYLEHLSGSLGLPTVRATLAAAGLEAHTSPAVTDRSATKNNETFGQATTDVRFNIGTQVTEDLSYIDNMIADGTVTEAATDHLVEIDT